MAAYRSADENREPFISCMGDELGALFNRLSNECGWLHLKWGEYVALFGTDQGRLDVLNASAKGFFYVVDQTLWADVLLHICRLTDDRTVGRRNRETLSVHRFPGLVRESIEPEVRKRLSVVRKTTEFARDWRDRHIAHSDLHLALREGAKPLAPASRQRVNQSLDAIVAVLDVVESQYCQSETGYRYAFHTGDAESLLGVLRRGLDTFG